MVSVTDHEVDFMWNKPVRDRDHEVLGMGSFGEYTQLCIRELSSPSYHKG
jgi:hypothetical protein